jgi:hypothetical protein
MGLAALPRMIERGLGRLYRKVVPKYDPAKRASLRRIVGTVGVGVGAAAGATALGALLSACKERSETAKPYARVTVKPKGIEIVTNSIAAAAKKTRPYGFYIKKWGRKQCVYDKKVVERKDYALVAVDINRVRRIEFVDANSAFITIDGQHTKKGSKVKVSYGPSFLNPFSMFCSSTVLISGFEMKDGVPYRSVEGFLPPETITRDWGKMKLRIEYKDGSVLNATLKKLKK